jgi:lysophospholipase L1-like esterase
MILFIGDSFTYGQGLQYYYLNEHKGWNWEECENFYQKNKRFEWLGFEEDEFRRKNGFPYLVSKEIDLPFQTPRMENGSDNEVTYEILQNIQPFCTTNNITFIVIQFSEPSRSILNGNEPKFNTIDEQIEHQVQRISDLLDSYNIDWLGISWMPEIGKILKEKYSQNFVPIKYKDKYYDCFESAYNLPLQELKISYTEGIDDGHFNLLGHQVISESILEKYYSRTDLVEKVKKLKEKIK